MASKLKIVICFTYLATVTPYLEYFVQVLGPQLQEDVKKLERTRLHHLRQEIEGSRLLYSGEEVAKESSHLMAAYNYPKINYKDNRDTVFPVGTGVIPQVVTSMNSSLESSH